MDKLKSTFIKGLVKNGYAKDITYLQNVEDFRKDKNLEQIGYSSGKNGKTAALLRDRKTGVLYAITSRCTNLDYFT